MAERYVRAEDTFITPDGKALPPQPSQGAAGGGGSGGKKKILMIFGGVLFLFMVIIAVALTVANSKKKTPPEVVPEVTPTATAELSPTPTIVEPTTTPTILPTLTPTPTKEPGRIPISGVAVKDFTQFAQGKLPNGDVLLVRTDDYQIIYSQSTQAFTVTILVENFIKVREVAEAKFIDMLGVTEENACRLTVTVGSPSHINSKYAGLVFPLSWCGE